MTSLIKIDDLTVYTHRKGQEDRELIHKISFDIPEYKITGLVGESGSGKSMTMKAIMNLLPDHVYANFGKYNYLGTPIDIDKEHLPISMIFQDPMTSLNPLRTIGFHLLEVINRFNKISDKEAKDIAIKELELVGITNPKLRMKQYPHELSGGMRQRIMIAMAMLRKPRLLIADEPTTALDVTIQAQILDLILQRQIDDKLTVALVTHDFGVIAEMCDYVIVMYKGYIVEKGKLDDVFYNPQHTYTQELIKAIPSGQNNQRLYSIDTSRIKFHSTKFIDLGNEHFVLKED